MKLLALSTLALTIAMPLSVQAKPDKSRYASTINHRQSHQEHRLVQGIQSGSLTAHEVAGLQQSQSRIRATEARMRADGGGLSATERAQLQAALSRQSQAIFAQKRDAQTRSPIRR